MMTKKKVTIITLQNVQNYGSVLQALATQNVFEKMGWEVDFIDYWKNNSDSKSARLKEWIKGRNPLIKILMTCLLWPSFVIEDRIFGAFRNKYLHTMPGRRHCIDEFEDFPITSDVYCTGSDQTWNSGWNCGILPELFLRFVPDNKKKIAYAASFGKEQLDEWELEETRELINRYSAISVRESSAVQICEGLGYKGAVQVLDPTLQVDREFWVDIASERPINEPYVLVYQLNTNSQFDRYAKEYARRKGCKLVRFCIRIYQTWRGGKVLFMPKPETFVSAIANAETVITDSFHATAFSCNLNTPMICIYPNEYSSRLASILKLLELEDRHLTSYNDFSFVDRNMIDFDRVNAILKRERQKGWDYLSKALYD